MKKPNIFKRIILFIVDSWGLLLWDVKYNPLKHIPDPSLQTYFMLSNMECCFWNNCNLLDKNSLSSIYKIFTNAVFIDAERDGEKWLKEWREEQSRFRIVANRLKTKNLVLWNPYKEA